MRVLEKWLLPTCWILVIFKNKLSVRNTTNSNEFNDLHNHWEFYPNLWKSVGSFINKINVNLVKLSSVCSLLPETYLNIWRDWYFSKRDQHTGRFSDCLMQYFQIVSTFAEQLIMRLTQTSIFSSFLHKSFSFSPHTAVAYNIIFKMELQRSELFKTDTWYGDFTFTHMIETSSKEKCLNKYRLSSYDWIHSPTTKTGWFFIT